MQRALLLIVCALQAVAQSTSFDVISVKPSEPGTQGGRLQFLNGGRFYATNVPLTYVIQQVFGVLDFQVVGDARLLGIIADGYRARYDIQAKGDPSATDAQLKEMVKGLLAQRFGLKVHKDTRELRVYALTPTAKIGVQPTPVQASGRPPGSGGIQFMAKGWIQGSNVSMPSLVRALSELVDRPVVDKTGFSEAFDFRLTYDPGWNEAQEPGASLNSACPASFAALRERRGLKPEASSCPSIFTAVQEQLGFRLEARREPVDVLVIDDVARPDGN